MDATTSDATLRRDTTGRVRRERRRLVLRYGLIGMGALALIVGGIVYWLSGGRYVAALVDAGGCHRPKRHVHELVLEQRSDHSESVPHHLHPLGELGAGF